MSDLNQLSGNFPRPNSASSTDGSIKVFFNNIEEALIDEIEKAEAVVGVVAWLTNRNILDALAKKRYVSILVSKQDFLRYDTNSSQAWPLELREMYETLARLDNLPTKFESPRLADFS